ncbi:WD40 repeat-like protein [Xylaria digitata]|nr:WD40 repeat-like protein [Xylaria digitata]
MTGPRPDAFQQALKRFKNTLHPSLANEFSICTLQDVRDICRDIQTTHGQEGKLRYMRRLEGFIEAMEQFGKVIELFVNVSEVVCFVWGPIKLLLVIASTYIESFDKLLDVYDQVGKALPGLLRYQMAFEKHPPLATVLEDYYSDILAFHQEALLVFKRPKWKVFFHSTWRTFNSKFGPILHSLSKRRELLESEKGSATLYEIQKLRDDLSNISAQHKQRAAQEDAEKHKQKVASIREKLEAPDYWIDQEISTEDRLGYNSGMWIFEDSNFRSWVSNNVTGHRVLYVNGIPGAGKTTLISAVIERLLDSKYSKGNKPCVAYFYFKQKQPTKESHNSLLRAILAQLIDRDPTMSDHVFKQVSCIEGVNLRSTNKLQMLVKAALESYPISYIVLDGLDECAPTEAEKAVNWFLSLKNGGLEDTNAKLRVLFCGQRDGTLDKLLADQPSISLETSRHTEDIRQYCRNFCPRIRERFNISANMEEDIIQRVTNKAEGMFLYARVVLENLLSQTRLSRLREEMEPGTFPQGIEKGYERVTVRIFETSSKGEREDAMKILGWITCARRLLRWREIQSLFCIDPVKGDVDYEERRLRVTCKELCGSLIDVHRTTNKKQGPEDIIKIQGIMLHAVAGYYSLQDYAVQYWFDHLRQCIKSLATLPQDQLRGVINDAQIFLEAYGLQSKIQAFQGTSSYEGISKIVTDLPEDGSERNAYFTIEFRTTLIRNIIETISRPVLDPADECVLVNLHGETASYKCTKPWCEYFATGFENTENRKQHTNRHDLPFRCPFESCFAFKLGFDSEAKLGQHKRTHHPEPDADKIVFPKIHSKNPDFWAAIERGDLSTVVALLDSGDYANRANPRNGAVYLLTQADTALVVAAEAGHFDVCNLLIEKGANINYSSQMGRTALHGAVVAGNLHIVDLLVNRKECIPDVSDNSGITPFYDACVFGHLDIVKLLVETGKIQVERHLQKTAERDRDRVLSTGPEPISPLHYACIRGHLSVAQYLLQHGHAKLVDWAILEGVLRGGHEAIFDLLRPIIAENIRKPIDLKTMQDNLSISSDPATRRTLDVTLVHNIQCTSSTSMVNCIQFSPDGKYLATGCIRVVQLFDVTKGEYLYTFPTPGPKRAVRSVCFSPDGKHIAAGGDGKSITIWDFVTRAVRSMFSARSAIQILQFTQDGGKLASGAIDGIVQLWDIEAATSILTFKTLDIIIPVSISPDTKFVAVSSWDNHLWIWDIQDGSLLERLDGYEDGVCSVAFSPNGNGLVSGSLDKIVKMWELSVTRGLTGQKTYEWRCIRTFNNHTDAFVSAGFTHDAQLVFFRSRNNEVTFWDPHTGQLQFTLCGHKKPIVSVAASPISGYFATGSEFGYLHIWSYKRVRGAWESH